MAVFFEFQDSGLDDYNKTKNFLQMGFRPGFAIQARELTQMQTLLQAQFYALARKVVGDNGILDAPLSVRRLTGSAGSPSTFDVTLNPGYVLIRPQDKELGYAVYVDSQKSFTVSTSEGQPFVYLQYRETQVNPDGGEFESQDGFANVEVDPTLLDNAQGYYNSSAPGASRYKMEVLNMGAYTASEGSIPTGIVNIIYFANHVPYFMNGTPVSLG
tara:strand:- start:57 stop:701 length:645 start_codon:yes stop_codon:yes gene_type:complete